MSCPKDILEFYQLSVFDTKVNEKNLRYEPEFVQETILVLQFVLDGNGITDFKNISPTFDPIRGNNTDSRPTRHTISVRQTAECIQINTSTEVA